MDTVRVQRVILRKRDRIVIGLNALVVGTMEHNESTRQHKSQQKRRHVLLQKYISLREASRLHLILKDLRLS